MHVLPFQRQEHLYLYGLTLILAWISNHMTGECWDEISAPRPRPIQHTNIKGNITSGLYCTTISTLNKCKPNIIKTQQIVCWETSTKVILDGLRRGRREYEGVMCLLTPYGSIDLGPYWLRLISHFERNAQNINPRNGLHKFKPSEGPLHLPGANE